MRTNDDGVQLKIKTALAIVYLGIYQLSLSVPYLTAILDSPTVSLSGPVITFQIGSLKVVFVHKTKC